MKYFLRYAFLSLFLSISFHAFAEDCSGILNENSATVAVKAENMYTICDEDFAAQFLNLMYQDAFKSDTVIQAHYKFLGLPTPNITSGKISLTSQTLSSLAMSINLAILYSAYGLIFLIFIVGLAKKGLGQGLREALGDTDNWKPMAHLLLVLVLLYPVSQFSTSQTLAIFVAGAGLKLATYLFSNIIGIFSFSAVLAEDSVNSEEFKEDGMGYAAILTTIMLESKLTQATFNKANAPKVQGEFNDKPSDLANVSASSTDGSFEFFDGSTERAVTINDYVKNMLTQSSTELTFSDIYQFANTYEQFNLEPNYTINARVISGQTVAKKDDAIATSTLNKNLSKVGEIKELGVDGRLVEPFLELDLYEEQVFNSVFFSKLSGNLETENEEIIKHLIDSKLTSEFATTAYAGLYDTSAIESASIKLSSVADSYVAKQSGLSDDEALEMKKEYLNAAQAYLFGYYSYLKTSNQLLTKNGAEFAFNAFNKQAIPRPQTNQFLNNLSYANDAARHYLTLRCSELMFDVNEAPKVYSQLRLMKQYADDSSVSASSAVAAKMFGHSGQCFAYEGNAPIVLVTDDLKTKFYEADEALNKDNGKIRVQLGNLKSSFEKEILTEKEALNSSLEMLSNYYANIMSITARSKHKLIVKDSAGAFSVLSDLRKSGVMAMSKYMTTVFMLVSDLSSSVKAATTASAEFSTSVNKSTFSLDVLQDRRLMGYRDAVGQAQMALGEGASQYFNVNSDFTPFASAQQSQLESERSTIEQITNKIIDMAIPGDDTLKEGFGFDKDATLTDSLNACSVNSAKCLTFTQNSLITLLKYGNDLMNTGISLYLLVTLMDSIEGLADDLDDVLDSALGAVGSKDSVLKAVGKAVTKVGKFVIKSIIIAVKAITDTIAPLTYLLIGAGITLFFISALAPMLGFTLLFINWLLEVALVFIASTLLCVLSLIKINRSPLFTLTRLLGMYLSIFLRPPLYVVAFALYMNLTDISIGSLISLVGGIIGNATSSQIGNVISNGGGLSSVISTFLFLTIFVYLFYSILMKVTSETLKVPDYVLKFIGVEGFSLNTITSTEGMIGGGVMAGAMSKVMGGAREKAKEFGGKAKEKARQRAAGAQDYKQGLQKKLNDEGYNIDLDSFDKKGGGR